MENVRHLPPPPEDDGLGPALPEDTAEQFLIGAVLDDARGYQRASELIQRADIRNHGYRLIWDVAGQLLTDKSLFHPVAVRTEIERMGRLREIGHGRLIDDLAALYLPAGSAEYFAEQVAERARVRRAEAFAVQYRQAAAQDPDALDKLLAEYTEHERERAEALDGSTAGPSALMESLLDWGQLFETDFGNVQLLPGRLMAPGQQIALVGDGKAGKSLFALEWIWRMATGQRFLDSPAQDPIPVLYIDAENGHEQIQSRLISYGATPETMGLLHYASFPRIRPLDTAAGGADLMALVKATGAQVVVIDTISRFISGVENDADTWLSLYRHTLLPLKAAGIASIRLDHFGKDRERGGRGSSAKTQDVDHVWELAAQGGGIVTLKRTHTRTGVGEDEFVLLRQARKRGDHWEAGGTRHVLMVHEPIAQTIEGTLEWLVLQIDKLGLPDDAGNPRTIRALANARIPAGKDKIAHAVRVRKNRTNGVPGNLPNDLALLPSPGESPSDLEETPKPQVKHSPETPREGPGTPPSPLPPPTKGGEGAGKATTTPTTNPPCALCNHPLPTDWAARGYDRHVICDTTTNN